MVTRPNIGIVGQHLPSALLLQNEYSSFTANFISLEKCAPSLYYKHSTHLSAGGDVTNLDGLALVVVEVLLGDTATEELGLGATDVDVLVEDLRGGIRGRHLLGLGDLGVDALASLLVNRLELCLGGDLPVEDLLLESGDGVVGAAHTLDLLTGLGKMLEIAVIDGDDEKRLTL